jgi:hypothetical protein
MRALIVALTVAVAAPATTLVARLDTGPVPVIAGARVGTLRQAVRRFGKPDRAVPVTGTRPVCLAIWRQYGLEIRFSTSTGCRTPGPWWQVTMRAARWQTRTGLHVGDDEAKLHSLYPDAKRLDFPGLGTLWKLETGGPLCDGGPPLALAARTAADRITALLVLHVPACG